METIRIRLGLKPKDIAYFRGTMESYDGMAVVRTIDPLAAVVELQISPGCESIVLEIVDDLMRNDDLHLTSFPVPEPNSPQGLI